MGLIHREVLSLAKELDRIAEGNDADEGAQVPALVLDGAKGKNSKELTLLRSKHCLNLFLCSRDSSCHGMTSFTHWLCRGGQGS